MIFIFGGLERGGRGGFVLSLGMEELLIAMLFGFIKLAFVGSLPRLYFGVIMDLINNFTTINYYYYYYYLLLLLLLLITLVLFELEV